jgi:hypothetical protein
VEELEKKLKSAKKLTNDNEEKAAKAIKLDLKVADLDKKLKLDFPKGTKLATDTEKKAAETIQSELNEKAAEARDIWQNLQKKLNKDAPEDRPLWLMATKHLRGLPEASKNDR